MRVADLLSLSRLSRARTIFQDGLSAHVAAAGGKRAPFRLQFRRGGEVSFPDAAEGAKIVRHLLGEHVAAEAVSAADNAVRFVSHGVPVAVRPGTTDFFIFNEVFRRDEYRLAGLAPESLETVVDLGANVGLFALRAAGTGVAKRVLALEAAPENAKVAQDNLTAAGLADRVTLVQRAVSDRSGETITLHLSSTNTGGHSIDASLLAGTRGSVSVETITLPDALQQHGIERVSLLKCDVEGAEYRIFAGVPDELLTRIERVAMEVHVSKSHPEREMRALVGRLESAGHRVEILNHPREASAAHWTCMLFSQRGTG